MKAAAITLLIAVAVTSAAASGWIIYNRFGQPTDIHQLQREDFRASTPRDENTLHEGPSGIDVYGKPYPPKIGIDSVDQ